MTQQENKSNAPQNQAAQGELARSSQRGAAGVRVYDPLTLSLNPLDFFRMSPFSLMGRMMEEMDRVLPDEAASGNGGRIAWIPAIEVTRHNGHCSIRAELPGLKPEDVKIEVTPDSLILEGERKFESEDEKNGVYRTERRYGHFYRSVPLPDGADVEHARAKFENGVLEITLPIQERASDRRQIPIEA
jgi:HSP20 family protein